MLTGSVDELESMPNTDDSAASQLFVRGEITEGPAGIHHLLISEVLDVSQRGIRQAVNTFRVAPPGEKVLYVFAISRPEHGVVRGALHEELNPAALAKYIRSCCPEVRTYSAIVMVGYWVDHEFISELSKNLLNTPIFAVQDGIESERESDTLTLVGNSQDEKRFIVIRNGVSQRYWGSARPDTKPPGFSLGEKLVTPGVKPLIGPGTPLLGR